MQVQIGSFIRRHGDQALAIVLSGFGLAGVALLEVPVGTRVADAALVIVLGIAAAWRARAPLLLLGLILAVSLATAVLGLPAEEGTATSAAVFGFLLLAVYTAAAHTSGNDRLVAGAMTVGIYLPELLLPDPSAVNPDSVVFLALLAGAPWAAGTAVRSRRLKDRELEHERARAAAAIVEERARIARELHDVVAHSISVMVLQARGGRRVLDSEPADAREAFAAIEGTGQQALDEMRRLLVMLRRSDEELALAPQPTLRELDGLVEQVQAAGLPVQLDIEGEPRDLPPGVELSAFRIVQEALTNALRHAGPARARVVIRYGADDLELEIADDGPGVGNGSGAGYGLLGLRERVSVYGGELEAGRQAGGGYALRVRLPLGPVRA
jgi:signal transduction histidine kinase